jgi:hypothetical protein
LSVQAIFRACPPFSFSWCDFGVCCRVHVGDGYFWTGVKELKRQPGSHAPERHYRLHAPTSSRLRLRQGLQAIVSLLTPTLVLCVFLRCRRCPRSAPSPAPHSFPLPLAQHRYAFLTQMYSLLSGLYKQFTRKEEYFVLILGLDNAGKTVSHRRPPPPYPVHSAVLPTSTILDSDSHEHRSQFLFSLLLLPLMIV